MLSLPPEKIMAVCRVIYRQFPELRGSRPQVQTQPGCPGSYLLTFARSVPMPGGKKMMRWARARVNAQGQILKITTSR